MTDTLFSYCEQLLDQFEPAVIAGQAAYRQSHGVYCQLPRPMDQTPADGALADCDWSRKFDDVSISWDQSSLANLLPSQLPCNVWSDVATSFGGNQWFSVNLEVLQGGNIYRYRRTYNHEGLYRTHDWYEVTDGEI